MDSKKKKKRERKRKKKEKKERYLRDNAIRWNFYRTLFSNRSLPICQYCFFNRFLCFSNIVVIYCVLRINSKANARDSQTIMIHSFNYLSRSTMRSMIYDDLQLRSVSVTTRQCVGVGELVIVKRWQRLDREDKLCHLRTMIAIIAIVVSR